MRPLILLFGAMFLVILLPFIFTAIEDAQTDIYSQTFTEEVTAVAVTNTSVTLAVDLWDDAVSSVTDIDSSLSGETPSAFSYVSADQELTITGMASDSTRNLTVQYRYAENTVEDFDTNSAMLSMVYWFTGMGVLGLIGASVYTAYIDYG